MTSNAGSSRRCLRRLNTDPYDRLRRRVLFEVWFPAAEDVRLTAIGCERCGFATHSPRPTAAHIDAKYRFLQRWKGDVGGSTTSGQGRRLDAQRAKRTYRALRDLMPKKAPK